MPAFITHLLNEKSDGGRIGEAMRDDRIVAVIDALDVRPPAARSGSTRSSR